MNLSHSKTLECLINAFAGESQARNRYTFYAKQAKKEGYEQIAAIFLETADNEKQHAKMFYKHIPADKYQVTGYYPFFLGNTYENLLAAAEGEREEWQSAVEYLSEATATAERPLSALGGTLSSVLLAHKDEVNTLFTAKDAVEFLDRIRPEVKNVGYVDKVKADIMRKRGIIPVQYFYNIILKGDGQGTDKGGVVSKKSQIKKWAAQPATEAVEDDDKPYTYRQVFDELKLETKNFTVDEGAGKYGYESEANHAVKILEKHYASVELDTVGSWFQVDFKDRLKKSVKRLSF